MAWICFAVPFWKIFDLFFSPFIFHTVKKDVPQILPFCDTSIKQIRAKKYAVEIG